MERALRSHRPAKAGRPERPGPAGLAVGLAVSAVVVARTVRRLRQAGGDPPQAAAERVDAPRQWPVIAAPAPASAPERPARMRRSSFDPRGRLWRWASVPVALVAVGGALLLIQGRGGEPTAESSGAATASPAPGGAAGKAQATKRTGGAKEARLVRGSRYSLALPPGWKRAGAQGGAAFAALSGGSAEATLWIERAPDLDFAAFEARSLEQLQALAGSARVVDRVAAPSPEATIVRLAADAPTGEPELEVTLRVAGPYRYYLATTVQPDASRRAIDGAEVIHGSFTPEAGGSG